MNPRPSVPLLATFIAWLACAPLLPAQQPGYPEAVALGPDKWAITAPPTGFMSLSLASEPEGEHRRPIVCFGLRASAEEYRYTYFVIFKTDRTKKWESDWRIDGGSSGFFHIEAYLAKIQLSFGDGPSAKHFMISYSAAWEEKTGALTKESLTIDGDVYGKGGPRVFLCDLTAETLTCKPLKVALPAKAPAVDSDEETMSAALIQSLRDVAEGEPEVREIFEGMPEK